jgi:protein-tyrosine phosphatase
MVCLGNICRSPLAEGILKKKIKAYQLDWQVDSAGTGSWHLGSLPDHRSVAIAEKHNMDITDQKARQIKVKDLDTFDLILVMDYENYRDVMKMASNDQQKEKIKLIMDFVYPDRQVNVPDPYRNDDGFEQIFEMLDQACEKIVEIYQK